MAGLEVWNSGEAPEPGERLAILEAFAAASGDALLSQNADGRITFWNRSAERILGYREGEILGRNTTTLFPGRLQAELGRIYDTVSAGGQVDHLATEVERKDGMPIPVSLCIRPVRDDSGRVVGAVSIVQDVTEMRLAQAALAEVEARLSGGEAQAHVGRWLWDIGTGAVQWSDELHRIHGVDPLDFAGTLDAHLSYAHPDDRSHVADALAAAVRTGQPVEEEYRIIRPEGDQRWIYLRAEASVSSAGTVVALRGIGQDVTDRRITSDQRGS
ncbi:MAG TPA: PAS domain S-box protein [Acidimicrobiales bacterium]|nr:PAS domain S-box protein [Acidimicrobiales bacterium]